MNTQGKENGHPERASGHEGRSEALDVLRRTAKRLRRALRDARRKDLAVRPSPSAWSVRDVIGHLSDHEVVLGSRLRLVASMDRPPLPAYDQNLFATRLGNERAKLRDLFAAFSAARQANLDLIERLPEEAWARTGLHPERGELSLETLVLKTAEHDRAHQAQVVRTLEQARTARRAAREERRAAKAQQKAQEKTREKARARSAKKSASAQERGEPALAQAPKDKPAKAGKGAKGAAPAEAEARGDAAARETVRRPEGPRPERAPTPVG